MRFDAVRLATGPKLHFVEQGGPDGDAIIFLHGWPDSWYSFSRVLPLLSAEYRLLAVDQRGFGDSERPESGYGIEELAGDIVAFMDALGIECAAIVGHSYGSFVARCIGLRAPERVRRLVLIGTGFARPNPALQELQESLRNIPNPIPVDFARDFQASTAYLPLPEEFFGRIITETLKLPARLWPVMIDKLIEYDDAAKLPDLTAPTLLLWGDRDALFPRPQQDSIVAATPHARLKVYEETGHCPNWERPEQVASDINRFLSR